MSARTVAEAIDACRRGWPIAVRGAGEILQLLAVETADADRLAAFAPPGGVDLLISAERAATLMLGNQAEAAGAAVRIGGGPSIDLDAAVAIVDPAHDLSHPFKGPFRTVAIADDVAAAAAAAIKLARLSGLLPAFFVRPTAAEIAPAPDAAAIATYDHPAGLRIASRARLPVAGAERCEIVAFRSAAEAVEHVALVIGSPNGRMPLVRLHSECLTGDVFGSLKCDCGPQLDEAIRRIAAEGWGILVYLRQEGRGIGLINKLRAYALQDQGHDTVDANLRLGFAIDAREFGMAARMLNLLGQDRVRLLTNNPAKVRGLEEAGIGVVERLPHATPANPFNSDYLDTKRQRTGHLL